MYTPAKKYRAISGREMWETWGAGSENLSQPHPADRVIGWSVAISTSDVLPLPILIRPLSRKMLEKTQFICINLYVVLINYTSSIIMQQK